ncbi:hypothetical protein [Tamlana flava]|uniref:hypothetical protein n=1 Tax=Tamlana flava TaxID=3158572 RepID=UPI00351B5869
MADEKNYLEDAIKDFNWQNKDPYGYWMAKLNDEQRDLITDLEEKFNSSLEYYSTVSHEEYQEKIDYHISFNSQKTILEREHFRILEKPSFLMDYRNILHKENNLINSKEFPKYIMGFKVIGLASDEVNEENEIEALSLLEDIAALNVLEFMIEMLKYERDKNLFNDKVYHSIKGQRFLKYVFDEWLKNEDIFNAVHFVLRMLWEKGGFIKDMDLAIKGNALNVMEHWNKVYAPYCKNKNAVFNLEIKNPKINEVGKIGNKRMESWTEKLKGLSKEFSEK